jgi:Outer membrane protein/protective antigen OMA87
VKYFYKYLIFTTIIILFSACNITKYVPENEYLLNSTRIQTDVNDISKEELNNYLRQQPNAKVLGFWNLALSVYNIAPKDTTKGFKRFMSKTMKRLGNEPVIYDESLTRLSAQQLQKLLSNRGYINAQVKTSVNLKNKRADLRYVITGNKPYSLGNYEVTSINPFLRDVATDTSRTLVRQNMLYDVDVLNAERARIAKELTERGFYKFDKEYLMFVADSANEKINLRLDLRRYLRSNPDSVNNTVFKRFTIGNIYFHNRSNTSLADSATDHLQVADTTSSGDFYLIDFGKKLVSLNALIHNTYINPNSVYNSSNVEKTYSALNALGPIKFVNIGFVQREDSILDCNIVISPAKTISTSAEIEGTFIEGAGYLGTALRLGMVNKNAFKGAESLSFQGRIATEWQKNIFERNKNAEREKGIWAQEYGLQIGLNIPKFLLPIPNNDLKRRVQANTEFTANVNYQYRPKEFNAANVGAGMKYIWDRKNYKHTFEPFNLSYVWFDLDSTFTKKYLTGDTIFYNRHNYDNRFILRIAYSGSYSTFNANRPLKNYSTYNYGIETAGNILYGIYKIADAVTKEPLSKGFSGFSQYVRTNFNTSYHQILDKNNRFVYHLGMGLGIPYGNSNIIPYERRFFSGGANSVRGWSESTLGPGVYKRMPNVRSRDFNQVGDVKLDMNMEYRAKMFWLLEGAMFLDAGNIWTFKPYEEQQGGEFKFNEFLSQIALAYGLGLRLDATMFIVRVDMGMKLRNPVMTRTEQWRVGHNFKFRDDFAFHLAIGYPF